jgi:hypothetical protein
MSVTITATQQVSLEAEILDSRGNPAEVHDARWETPEPETLTVTVDPDDPLKCIVAAAGPVDTAALVTFTADADLGEGVEPLIGTLDFIVTSGRATVVQLSAGMPTEQP